MGAGLLPHTDDEEAHRFTPTVTEVLLYQHAQLQPKIAGVLFLDIFGLYYSYTLVNRGISSQFDSGRAKESTRATSTARIQSLGD